MNEKLKKITYVLYFFALAMGFMVLYYGGYYYALNNMTSDNIITKKEILEENPALTEGDINPEVLHANQKPEDIITNKTKYVEELYDIDTAEITKTTTTPGVEVLGYNREQFIDYLSTYLTKQQDATLVNVQLVSFSSKMVVVRKSVRKAETVYNYYVGVSDDVIVVYKKDKKTKYIDTGISLSDVSKEEWDYISAGFYIETIHELYNYLEGITS